MLDAGQQPEREFARSVGPGGGHRRHCPGAVADIDAELRPGLRVLQGLTLPIDHLPGQRDAPRQADRHGLASLLTGSDLDSGSERRV